MTATKGVRNNRANISSRHIAIVFAVAALLSLVATLFVSLRAPRFYFEVSMRSSEYGTAQVYYDTGRGINAADSTAARVREGESTVRLPLPPGDFRSIRFDPIDRGYCDIAIHRAAIVDLVGGVVRRFSLEQFTDFHDLPQRHIAEGEIHLKLSAGESDPSFTIYLDPPVVLRPSAFPFWQFVIKTFFLCFVPLSALGGAWLLWGPRRLSWNGLLLCALAAFAYLGAWSKFFAPVNFDEGVFLWYGSLINAGSIPYRDIFEPKGPVIFFANAIGLSLFGFKDFLFRIVPTTTALASILLFYIAMRRRRIADWLTVLLTAQITLWLFGSDFHDTGLNDSETYGFAFTIIGFSLGSLAVEIMRSRSKITLQLLSGVFFGLAVLCKELFVFSVIPAWLFVGVRRDSGGWDWRQLLVSAGGGVFVGISFLGYLTANSALASYLALLSFSRTFAANYCVDLGVFPKVEGWDVIPPVWNMLNAHLYNFGHLAFVLALCALVIPISRTWNHKRVLIQMAIAASAVILGMVAVSMGYCFWRHYFLMGMTGLLLTSLIGAELLNAGLREKGRGVKLGTGAVLMAAFLFVAWSPTRIMLREIRSRHPLTTWDPLVTETIKRHSKPGDYILAPGIPVIFVALDRRNPYPLGGPTDDVLPYLAEANPELQIEALRRQLERNLPKVCYFVDWFRPKQKKWHELLYEPLLTKYQYVKVNDNLWYLPDSE